MPEVKEVFTFKVSEEDAGERIDRFLKSKLDNLSRSRIQSLVEEGLILVNGSPTKQSYKVKPSDEVLVQIPEEKELELVPKDVPFEVIYEDDYIAVINKPSGLVVHPAHSHKDDTLVHGLLKRLKNLSGIGGKIRPGIVHRLDKDTSGIMLIAKNDRAHNFLVEGFKKKEINKTYVAVVYKPFEKPEGVVRTFIGRHPRHRKKMAVVSSGKEAITKFKVVENLYKSAFLELSPVTGRTHQLRVHMSFLGHPILGDPVYGGLKPDLPRAKRLMLHAWKITFFHPATKEKMEFSTPIPEEIKDYVELLRSLKSRGKK